MTIIRYIVMVLVLGTLAHTGRTQAPSWSVDASKFQYSMTVVAFLNLDGTTLSSDQDEVGAFVGNEVRGHANLQWVESTQRYLAFLTVYANQPGETIQFKIYNSQSNSTTDAETSLPFSIDAQQGGVFQAFSIAKPLLNSEAAIKTFGFSNAYTAKSEVGADKVELGVDFDQPLDALIPEFILSEGASIYLNRQEVESATEALDFTETVALAVLSEDESQLRTYQIEVSHQARANADFLASNVISANGDGRNDVWKVANADRYRDYTFTVHDANGRVLYQAIGYATEWNGRLNGKLLDRGKYYYIVESPDKTEQYTGHILLLY